MVGGVIGFIINYKYMEEISYNGKKYIVIQSDYNGITTIAPKNEGEIIDVPTQELLKERG